MRAQRLERQVAAPAAVVWAVMTDLDRAPELMSGIEAVQRLDGGEGFGVGTRWRETRTLFGRTTTEELEITALEPGRSYTVEADSGGTHYRSVLGVEPTAAHGAPAVAAQGEPQASRLWMTFGAEPRGLPARVLGATLGRLFEGSTRKALQRDLDDIAAAAESRPHP